MSEAFLLYNLTITSGWDMFYLHLLIGLISYNKYWRVEKKLVLLLKVVIQIKIYFYETLLKIQTKKEWLNFLKTWKTRFWESFHFIGLCVFLIAEL